MPIALCVCVTVDSYLPIFLFSRFSTELRRDETKVPLPCISCDLKKTKELKEKQTKKKLNKKN